MHHVRWNWSLDMSSNLEHQHWQTWFTLTMKNEDSHLQFCFHNSDECGVLIKQGSLTFQQRIFITEHYLIVNNLYRAS